MKAFATGYKGLISGLFSVVAFVVLLLTGCCTTFLIGDWTEQVFLTHDAAWRNVLYLAVFAAVLFVLRRSGKPAEWVRRLNEDDSLYRNGQLLLVGLGTLMAILWVYSKQIVP